MFNRPGTEKDLKVIVDIEKQSFPNDPWPAATFDWMVSHQDYTTTVAEQNGEIAGFIIASKPTDGWIYVHDVAVAATWRHKGVGRYLMAVVLDHARQQHCSVHLHVQDGNEPAIQLYLSLGFEERARIKGYYPDNSDGLHMSWSAT